MKVSVTEHAWKGLARLRPAFSVTGSVTAGNLPKLPMGQDRCSLWIVK